MSSIDERVVEMQFNNAKFENGIKQTTDSLDKLKKGLELKDASKGFSDLDSASKKVNLSSIGSGVDNLVSQFSLLGGVGVAAMLNIGNAVVNAAKQFSNAFVTGPILDGFAEYETKMGSIQTIMANTARHGTTLETVNKELDALNEYSDKTIYNFAEMTKNASLFTNSGMKIEDATKVIKGFSNEAAASGTSAGDASRAAYQLSQALNTGIVRLMDWRSLQNVGMGNKNMQDGLVGIAKAMGTLKDGTKTANLVQKDFNGSLQEGWLTSDVMAKYLGIMAEENEELNRAQLASIGITGKQADAFIEQQRRAQDAATQVRTFSQLVGTLKESVASGWAETFGIIIGDFNEATGLWTSASNGIGEAIKAMSEARNDMLRGWKTNGGRDDLISGITNIVSALGSVIKPISQAFRDIFPPMTVERLVELTARFKEFTAGLKLSDTTSENLRRTFTGLFTIASYVVAGFGLIGKAVGIAAGYLGQFVEKILAVTASLDRLPRIGIEFSQLANYIKLFWEAISTGHIASGWGQPIIAEAARVHWALVDAFSGVIEWAGLIKQTLATGTIGRHWDSEILIGARKIHLAFASVMDWVGLIKQTLTTGTIGRNWDSPILIGARKIYLAFESVDNLIKRVMGRSASENIKLFADGIKGAFDILKTGTVDLYNPLAGNEMADKLLKLRENVLTAKSAIQDALSILKTGAIPINSPLTGTQISATLVAIKFAAMSLKAKIDELWQSLKNINLDTIKAGLSSLGSDIKSSLSGIDVKAAFSGFFANLGPMFQNLGNSIQNWLIPGIKNAATVAGGHFKSIGTAFKNVMVAIGTTIKKVFTNTDWDKVGATIEKLVGGGMLISLVKTFSEFGKLSGSISGTFDALKEGLSGLFQSTETKADALFKIAGGLAILAAALFVIASIPTEDLKRSMGAISILMAELAAVMIIFDKVLSPAKVGKFASLGVTLALFAAGVLLLATAAKQMGDVGYESLIKLSVVMGLLIGTAVLLSNKSGTFIKGAISLVVFSMALNTIVGVLKNIADIDDKSLFKGLLALTVIVYEMMLLMTVASSGIDKKGVQSLPLMAAAIELIANAVIKLSKIDTASLIKGLAAVALIFAEIAIFSKYFETSPDTMKAMVGLMALGVAINLIAIALKIIATMSISDIAKGLGTLGATLAILTIAMNAMPKDFGASAGQIMALSAGVLILAIALKIMATMSPAEIAKSLVTLAGAMLVLTIAMNAMPKDGLKSAGALMLIAMALGMLAPTLMLFAQLNIKQIGAALLMLAGALGIFVAAGYLVAPVVAPLLLLAGAILIISVATVIAGAGLLKVAAGLAALTAVGAAGIATLLLAFKGLISLLPFLGEQLGLALVAIITAIANSITALVDGIVVIVVALLRSLITVIREIMPDIFLLVGEFITQLLQLIIDKTPEIVACGMAIIIALLTGIRDNIYQIVTIAMEIITNFLQGIADRIGEIVTAGANIIIAFLQGLEAEIPRIADAALSLIETFCEEIGKSGKRLATAALNMIITFVDGVISAIGAQANRLFEAAQTSGQKVVDGFAQGLADVGGRVKAAAEKLGNLAKTALDSAKGIFAGSPSKKSTESGKWFSQGFAKGIDDYAYLADRRASAMGQSSIKTLSKTLSGVSKLVLDGGMDTAPTIRPVFDLSELKKGANEANGLLFNKPSIDVSQSRRNVSRVASTMTQDQTPAMQTTTNQGAVLNYVQNNYSPKELSRIDIYRQTKNQLSTVKGALTV